MYNVLVVDDEMFVRLGLRALIDWETLGFKVAYEAENGEEALAVIHEVKPDLVITDIRMPVLDGLELIKSVKEEKLADPSFIIVSGYHDFAYAQQAIRYGVHDYILKPIDDEELRTALLKLSAELGRKRLTRRNKDKSLHETILEALIAEHIGRGESEELAAVLDWQASSPYVYVIAEVHAPSQAMGTDHQAAEISAILSSLDIPSEAVLLHVLQQGRYGLLLNVRMARLESQDSGLYWNSFRSALSRAVSAATTLYIGSIVDHIAEVKVSYGRALEALEHRFAEEGKPFLHWEDVRGKTLHRLDLDQGVLHRMIEQMEENNREGYGKAVDSMFRQFTSERFSPHAIYNSLNRFVMEVLKVIRDMEGHHDVLPDSRGFQEWQNRPVDLQELKEMTIRFMEEAANRITCLRKELSKGGIEKIKKYIEAHYTENISLKSMAALFYMNPVYLGQLFRKTYGVYFNDFLLQMRIQEAKRLLRQTDMRMYEIAEKVGFQNADYFTIQFEKLEQATPTEYRNKLLGKS